MVSMLIMPSFSDHQQGNGEELFDTHGDSIDPKTLRFTQLRDLVLALPDFDDDPARCGEKILEAIQQVWISEAE